MRLQIISFVLLAAFVGVIWAVLFYPNLTPITARAAEPSIEVAGILENDTVWQSSSQKYVITGHVTVPEGKTLRIGAGTTVTWNQSKVLIVEGRLEVIGDTSNPATLLGTDGNTSGEAIAVKDTAEIILNHCVISDFDNTVVSYGDDSTADSAVLDINNCLFKDNKSVISWGNDSEYVSIANSSFIRNSQPLGIANVEGGSVTLSNNSFSNGGAVSVLSKGKVSVLNNSFVDNSSSNYTLSVISTHHSSKDESVLHLPPWKHHCSQ